MSPSKHKCLIYKFTFPNGKIYIGQTSVSFKSRLNMHRCSARKENPKLALHRAWKKYGEPVSQIVAYVEKCELIATEIRAIKVFNSFGINGYNLTPGGEASPMLVPEIAARVSALASTPERIARNREVHLGSKRSEGCKKQMSIDRKGMRVGIPQSPEHRKKISVANTGKVSLNRGRSCSDETKLKISNANTGMKHAPETEQNYLNRSNAHKGKKKKPFADEHKKNMSLARIAMFAKLK